MAKAMTRLLMLVVMLSVVIPSSRAITCYSCDSRGTLSCRDSFTHHSVKECSTAKTCSKKISRHGDGEYIFLQNAYCLKYSKLLSLTLYLIVKNFSIFLTFLN